MIRHFARGLFALIAVLVMALFWTLELPKTPSAPVATHVAAVPSYWANDGPFPSNPLRWCIAQPRGPPLSADEFLTT